MQPHNRLYLQYKPDQSTQQHLIDLQKHCMSVNPQSSPTLTDKLHMTLMHFGILNEMFQELKRAQPDLTWQRYEAAVRTFIDASQSAMPASAILQPLKLTLFGPKKSALALALASSPELKLAHEAACQAVMESLTLCGIDNPKHFILRSPNLRFSLEFQPHVTLARSAQNVPDVRIRKQPLHFSKMSVLYE